MSVTVATPSVIDPSTSFSAHDFALILPIDRAVDLAFQYYGYTDSDCDPPSFATITKIDRTMLPAQFLTTFTKTTNSTRWYVGGNVFLVGDDIQYQSFIWYDGGGSGTPPPMGKLTTNTNQFASTPQTLDRIKRSGEQAMLTQTMFDSPWSCNVFPVPISFEFEITSATITSQPVTLSPQVAAQGTFSNVGLNVPVTYSPTVNYTYTQTATATSSWTFTGEVDANASFTSTAKLGAGIAGDETSWTVGITIKFTASHTGTTAEATADAYSFSNGLQFTLQPNQQLGYSLTLQVDENATVSYTLGMQVMGKVWGIPLAGAYLAQVVQDAATNQGETITVTTPSTPNSTSCTYSVNVDVAAQSLCICPIGNYQ